MNGLKFLCLMLLTALCLTALSPYCFAQASAISVYVDPSDHGIVVNGSFGASADEKQVIMTVYKKDSDISGTAAEIDIQGFLTQIVFMEQSKTDENGNFSFKKFIPGRADGWNTVSVTESGGNAVLTENVYIASTDDVDTFISLINYSSADTIRTALDNETLSPTVGIDMKLYSILSAEQRKTAARAIEAAQNNSVSGLSQAYARINECCASVGILNYTSAAALIKYFPGGITLNAAQAEAVNTVLKPDTLGNTSAAKKLSGMTESEQLSLLSKLELKAYPTAEALYNGIGSLVIWDDIKSAKLWTDVTPILLSYRDCLGRLDFDQYKNSKYKPSIDKEIIQMTSVMSTDELCTFVNNAAVNGIAAVKPPVLIPSGGGGGGKGGAAVPSVSASSVVIGPSAPIAESVKDKREFSDIAEAAWAKDDILYLVGKGVINGKTEKLFCPNDTLTREEFVKMLVLAFDLNGEEASLPFSDVGSGEWFYPYIMRAYAGGLVFGGSDRKFGIGEPITRQDMAVMAARLLNASGAIGKPLTFADTDSMDAYALGSVAYLSEMNVLSGYEDNTFRPNAYCLRAQAAKVVRRLMELKL